MKLKTFTYSFLPNNTDIRGFNKFAISSRVKTMPPGVRYSGYSWEDNEYRRCDAEKIKKIHGLIFKWILKKDTESLELVGLSYYKVIIKPLLKLLERNKSIGISKTKGNVLQK